MSDTPPKNSTTGLGMFSTVGKGEKEAVEFFNQHVEEVTKLINNKFSNIHLLKETQRPFLIERPSFQKIFNRN